MAKDQKYPHGKSEDHVPQGVRDCSFSVDVQKFLSDILRNIDLVCFLAEVRVGGFCKHVFLSLTTIKFLNFWTPENFAVIYLKFKQRGQSFKVFYQNDANGIANSEDPDQTAPLGAV